MLDSAMHAQLDSRFMSAPAEIRCAVYQHLVTSFSIHMFLSPQGPLQLSTCLGPPTSPPLEGWPQSTGNIRPHEASEDDPTWIRRVRSSWGPHWECEEASYSHGLDHICNLLQVCKKMFLDVCTMVFERSAINVTDLATLELLSRKPTEDASSPSPIWNLANHAYPLVQRLNITLLLPLAVYEALADVQDNQPGRAAQYAGEDATAIACATWARACPAVCHLPLLRNLHVWMDHDGASSWSHVRERQAVGEGLMGVLHAHLQDRSRGKNLPPVEVLFNLPKLHPALARPETHYMPDSPPPLFSIERRFRLGYHVEEGTDGISRVKHEDDYPITRDWAFFNKFYDNPEDLDWDKSPVTEEDIRRVESLETLLWERGDDVYAFKRDIENYLQG